MQEYTIEVEIHNIEYSYTITYKTCILEDALNIDHHQKIFHGWNWV